MGGAKTAWRAGLEGKSRGQQTVASGHKTGVQAARGKTAGVGMEQGRGL